MHATYNGMDTKKAESFLYHKGCDIVDGQYGFYTRPKKEGDKPQFVPCGSAVEVQEVVIDIETMKRKLKRRTKNKTNKLQATAIKNKGMRRAEYFRAPCFKVAIE